MRRALALGLLAFLAVSTGCVGPFGPGPVNEEKLTEDATYGALWNSSADAVIDVGKREYRAVYEVNSSEFEVYHRDGLGTERPLEVRALKFRYPNGTVVSAAAGWVEKTRKRTIISLPAPRGEVAFTAPRQGKRVATPTFVTGSYEVILPAGTRVSLPIFGQVSPRGYETELVENRVHIRWNDVQRNAIVVRYYLVRDIQLFGGLAAILAVVTVFGVAYYVVQIRQLEEFRKKVGLDVDTGDDDFGGGPPPGMR